MADDFLQKKTHKLSTCTPFLRLPSSRKTQRKLNFLYNYSTIKFQFMVFKLFLLLIAEKRVIYMVHKRTETLLRFGSFHFLSIVAFWLRFIFFVTYSLDVGDSTYIQTVSPKSTSQGYRRIALQCFFYIAHLSDFRCQDYGCWDMP